MQRREFLQIGGAVLAAGMLGPVTGRADNGPDPMAGGVYYTDQAEGRWAGKAGSHMPVVEVGKDDQGAVVKVTTRHGMSGCTHYIVKHVLLDANYRFLRERMFVPDKDAAPVSEFQVGDYKGAIHVLSVCNIHDTWLARAEI